MTWIVVLILTFSNGSVLQENTTAASYIECQQKIKDWVQGKMEHYKDQKNPETSQFITGCIEKDAEK